MNKRSTLIQPSEDIKIDLLKLLKQSKAISNKGLAPLLPNNGRSSLTSRFESSSLRP